MTIRPHKIVFYVLLLALICALYSPAQTQSPSIPYLTGRVNDYAGVLSFQTRSELERILKAHENSTTNQIVVLTITSLEGAVLEEYSLKVAETWKLGQKDKNSGALFLIVKNDRKIRIEVGYGLEAALTDAVCSNIIRHEVVPRFKSGDFDGGVKAGVSAILGAIGGTYTAAEKSGTPMGLGEMVLFLGIFLVVVGTFTVQAILSKGFMSWFLFVFLIPFWLFFPVGALGTEFGTIPVFLYIVIFLGMKTWFHWSPRGSTMLKKWSPRLVGSGSSGWSFSGGGWSSSGEGFSGGGGSFGGGGSSGSW